MKIALVGIGKIAVDQHVPSIAAAPEWELAATVSRSGTVPGVEAFTDMDTMLRARSDIAVVSLCLPPVPRYAYAKAALLAGRHVMLEKPPGATLSECHDLMDLAAAKGVSLMATWHSREAAAVDSAKQWLAGKTITRAHVTWCESVRKWHPGQDWVFEPGGMGVFDPGINGLSVLTKILPAPVHLTRARLEFPENRQTPIAADLVFSDNVSARFNWLQETGETWQIEVETEQGTLLLDQGGDRAAVDGVELPEADGFQGEYPRLYKAMADVVRRGEVDMDLSPLRHVADAFMLGERVSVPPFEW